MAHPRCAAPVESGDGDLREAIDLDAVRNQASVVSVVKEKEKMAPRVPLHVSGLEIMRSCTEAIVESIEDGRDIDYPLRKSFP